MIETYIFIFHVPFVLSVPSSNARLFVKYFNYSPTWLVIHVSAAI